MHQAHWLLDFHIPKLIIYILNSFSVRFQTKMDFCQLLFFARYCVITIFYYWMLHRDKEIFSCFPFWIVSNMQMIFLLTYMQISQMGYIGDTHKSLLNFWSGSGNFKMFCNLGKNQRNEISKLIEIYHLHIKFWSLVQKTCFFICNDKVQIYVDWILYCW